MVPQIQYIQVKNTLLIIPKNTKYCLGADNKLIDSNNFEKSAHTDMIKKCHTLFINVSQKYVR